MKAVPMHKHLKLENRLINFSVLILAVAEKIPSNRAGGIVLRNQISKSCTSPALNYGEAQSAESKKDFIHKMKIVLKELRETNVCLKIIQKQKLVNEYHLLEPLDECNQLISIFVTSINTASKRG